MKKYKIAASREVRVHAMVPVECNGKKLLLTRTPQGLSVLDRKCTHLGANLCKGTIEEGAIVCPWHGARFNAATGEPVKDARMLFIRMKVKPLSSYLVTEEDGDVFVTMQ
ncbi:Rieske (2Fe-2S) protein [Acidovorax sp. NPDC077693]|uniref:Rieske (2Fe-2S) protein n=1 Tax=unclassified Acidovorax TaxID=2684926 RepID=UPI0037CC170A